MRRFVDVGLILLITLIIGYLIFITPFYFIRMSRMDVKTMNQNMMEQRNRQEIARFLESN